MMLRRAVPVLLAIACAVQGAEMAWSGAPGASAPPGWSVKAGASAKVLFLDRALEITATNDVQALAIGAVDLPDGSDERPLRVSASLSVSGDKPVTNYPALLALEWADGAVFAVGLGIDPHSRRDERRAWALWNGAGMSGAEHAELELFAGASPAQVRIVLTANEIAAYGSRDGWTWMRINGVPRERLGARGAPARVVCGRGQLRAGAIGLAADPPGDPKAKLKPSTYRFAALSVENGPADIPAALMRTYSKLDSLADTVDGIAAAGRPLRWRIKGPEPVRESTTPVVLPEGFLAAAGWAEQVLPETTRVVQIGRMLPGTGNHLRWATTEVTTTEAGWVRLRFDGARRCWLWVDNRLVAASPADTNEVEPDRLSASVWLPAGTHPVVMAVHTQSGSENRAVFALRWEQGDPRWRIALLRRLAIDFPGDEALEGASFEISRLWEGMGYAREAALALDDVIAGGVAEQVERARIERARLFNQLGDAAAATAETAALQQLWAASASDPVSAARRAARLWQHLDVPERALAVLSEAMAQPGLSPDVRSTLAVDQARLHRIQADEAGVSTSLRAAAELLPATDQGRFDLLAAALRADPKPERTAVEALAAIASDAQRARVLAGVCAMRKDEPGRIAARRLAAGLPATGLAMPAIELAEDLVAAKDEAGAVKLYQAEMERRKQKPAANLADLRGQLLRSILAETPAGAALLAEAAHVPPGAARALTWKVCGPVPLGDWKAHEEPAFAVAKGVDAGPVAGKPWQDLPGDAWQGGVLDLGRFGATDNAVMYLATTIESDADRRVTGSFGADDGLSVWLNGERIYSDRVQRGLQPDSVPITMPLRTGVNVLVCSVQNGGGPTAFQARMRREPWPASDVAAVLADVGGAARASAGSSLLALAESLAAAERRDQAYALARAVIACWPENIELQLRPARSLLFDRAWTLEPQQVSEIIAWFDAILVDRRWEDADLRRMAAEAASARMLETGLVEECLTRQRRAALTELDPLLLAEGYLRETDLWLGMGFPRQAALSVAQARDAAPGNEDIEAKVASRQRQIRARKGDVVTVATPFEMATLLRTAERAAAGGDSERAATDWQQAIESGRDLPVPTGEGRMAGAATLAANRLAGGGDAVIKAWLDRQAQRAVAALDRLGPTAGPEALDRIAQRWPLASAAAVALARESAAWAADGHWSLALGTAQRAMAGLSGSARGPLLVRSAQAAAHLGDATALEAQLAELAKMGAQSWDVRQLPPDRLAAALRGLLPAPAAAADPRALALKLRLPSYALAMRAATGANKPVPQLAQAGGLLVVALPDAVAAFAADGSLRWRLTDDSLPAADPPVIPLSGETSALAVDGGVVLAGWRSGMTRRLVAIDLETGRRLWSSSDQPQLAGLALASEPTIVGDRIWAFFVASGRGVIACLDTADGSPRWMTTLGSGLARQPLVGQVELVQTGDAPAPVLRGRELYVSSDAGQVAAVDAVDGRLLWLHAYPRSAFDPRTAPIALQRLLARGRGSIQADDDRVYVAPRDALGVIAINRRNGAGVWSSDLVDIRELADLTPQGLLGVGAQLCCFDPATGVLRWRSSRRAGSPLGLPAVVGELAWFATETGLIRVDLVKGSAAFGATWKALGIEGSPPTRLCVAGDRVLASGDSVAAVLAATGSAAHGDLPLAPETLRHQITPAGTAAPAAMAVRWELPVGRVVAIQRPIGAAEDEVYVIADGSLTRCAGSTGVSQWTIPVRMQGLRTIQVAGDLLLVWSDAWFAVHDRATGRLRWRGDYGAQSLLVNPRDAWVHQACLSTAGLVRWRYRESIWSTYAVDDGRQLLQTKVNGLIVGGNVLGDEVHLAVARGRTLVFLNYRLADGVLVAETPSPVEVDDWPSCRGMPDGGILVSSRLGAVWYRGSDRRTVKVDLGMQWLSAWWKDGERFVLAGVREGNRNASSTLEADGRVICQQELTPAWGEIQQCLNRVDRWVGDVRLRLTLSRKEDDGIQAFKADGSELFWLPSGDRGRRAYQWVVPYGTGAMALINERGGRRRIQYIDIPSGKPVCESALPASQLSGVMPQVVGDNLLLATDRGVVAVVPVAQAPEVQPSLADEEPLTGWKSTSPLLVDGHLEDWADLASWEVPGVPGMTLGLTWRDDGLAVAMRIPRLPGEVERALIAIDPIRDGGPSDPAPLLLDLVWNDGQSTVHVLDMPVREDEERKPVQARARVDGTGLVWESVIPWAWLFPKGERLTSVYNLSAAVVPTGLGSAVLELGGGLLGGVDRSRFLRIKVVDRKAEANREPKESKEQKKKKK
jgi:outer membrane protein assembly factor BamB